MCISDVSSCVVLLGSRLGGMLCNGLLAHSFCMYIPAFSAYCVVMLIASFSLSNVCITCLYQIFGVG